MPGLLEPGIRDIHANDLSSSLSSGNGNTARTGANIQHSLASIHPGPLHEDLSCRLDETTDRRVVTALPQLTLDLLDLLVFHETASDPSGTTDGPRI